MRYATLFSGIGGPEIAADSLGWQCQFQCEINPFCRQVLAHYFPNIPCYENITTTDFTIWRGKVDCIIGGFPCQPFSTAGKRKGTDDERHLWPQMLRVIDECRPTWVIGENVAGLTSMAEQPRVVKVEREANLEGETIHRTMECNSLIVSISEDLERLGYTVQPVIVPAAGVNAPHPRARIFFIAYANEPRPRNTDRRTTTTPKGNVRGRKARYVPGALRHNGFAAHATRQRSKRTKSKKSQHCQPKQRKFRGRNCKNGGRYVAHANICRLASKRKIRELERRRPGFYNTYINESTWQNFPTQPPVCSGNDGFPTQLDGITVSKWRKESLKAYGNAIVPQQILPILKAIHDYEKPH